MSSERQSDERNGKGYEPVKLAAIFADLGAVVDREFAIDLVVIVPGFADYAHTRQTHLRC